MLLEWSEIKSLLGTCGKRILIGRTFLYADGEENKQGTCNWHHTASKISIDIKLEVQSGVSIQV